MVGTQKRLANVLLMSGQNKFSLRNKKLFSCYPSYLELNVNVYFSSAEILLLRHIT